MTWSQPPHTPPVTPPRIAPDSSRRKIATWWNSSTPVTAMFQASILSMIPSMSSREAPGSELSRTSGASSTIGHPPVRASYACGPATDGREAT